MSVSTDFENELYAAADAKTAWYDNCALPKLVDEYRNYRAVFNTVLSMLLKKGFIQPDPYKLDKKLTEITVPDESEFKDGDRAAVLGLRLSEYESSLEFLCNYFKFSVENLTMDRIKKLIQLNNYISWNSLMSTTAKQNSRVLGEIFTSIKMGSDSLSVGVLNDSTNFISKSLARINTILKDVTDFKRELYKIKVRKEVLNGKNFAAERSSLTSENGVHIIKEHFLSAMGKQPFYTELIEEIVHEETSPDKEDKRQAVLNKLRIKEQETEQKRPKINTKQLLLTSCQLFSALAPQYTLIAPKIEENHHLLQSEYRGLWAKLKTAFRKAFNIPEKPIEYKLKVNDAFTHTAKTQSIDYSSFMDNLLKRSRLYASFGIKQSVNIQKIENMEEHAIFEYVQRQLSECNILQMTLEGFDEFFKTAVHAENRNKIKGIQIELTSVKNTLIKINQRKAEYSAYMSEQTQMEKLGIQHV
ncbi:hypothetical protein H0R92_08940 [Treponema sp. OMZ 840]|uniref:hypothetical protein n=1 Tax=Treponema sp. OMZ 840 TaxID=244313 RepID=UPI003D8E38DC